MPLTKVRERLVAKVLAVEEVESQPAKYIDERLLITQSPNSLKAAVLVLLTSAYSKY
jgi:hypothetical protein